MSSPESVRYYVEHLGLFRCSFVFVCIHFCLFLYYCCKCLTCFYKEFIWNGQPSSMFRQVLFKNSWTYYTSDKGRPVICTSWGRMGELREAREGNNNKWEKRTILKKTSSAAAVTDITSPKSAYSGIRGLVELHELYLPLIIQRNCQEENNFTAI